MMTSEIRSHKIFTTDSLCSYAHFVVKIDETFSLNEGFNTFLVHPVHVDRTETKIQTKISLQLHCGPTILLAAFLFLHCVLLTRIFLQYCWLKKNHHERVT